ncbi:putative hypersensitive response-inducing protein elicitor [Botryosphaeria dothidea]|uniref:Hypersensitive response-inducing protein elicitor n=1 Tax=Botryosphaeria dothidea TaxID=55169 RepID=A0A8H4IVX0_9PEZI|nr:putative hypersensitive response-inducing protein elicitor [Botryosphaeria dothidea]
MKVFAATALFAGLAAAATTVKVTDLSIRDNEGLQSVSFKVEGTDCTSTDPTTLAGNGANACGDGNPPVYTFSVEKNDASDYQLWLHKNVDGDVRGLNGGAKAPVYCHAGGNGANDFVCTQVSDLSVELQ